MKKLLLFITFILAFTTYAPTETGHAEIEHNIVEVVEEPTPQPPEKQYRYIEGCPLSEELQEGIFDICERHNISFELVMAVIERESTYNVDAVGDNGNSIGLMQIQPKWWGELMDELGVTDLSEPLQNVEVGVAILASYFEAGHEFFYVLMKYNGGAAYANRMIDAGKISEYALEVTETVYMYERQNGI